MSKRFIGEGRGSNPASHTFKYTKAYRNKMAKRNKSLSNRQKVSATLLKKHREDYEFAEQHRKMLTKRNQSARQISFNKTAKRRENIAKAIKDSWKDPEVRRLRCEGISWSWKDDSCRESRIAGMLKTWALKSEKEKAALVRAFIVAGQKKPNKPESLLNKILMRAFPREFKLNVKGEVILGGKVPDFVNVNGKKAVIEMFGGHWHEPFEERLRKDTFAKYGFKTLIIWEKELEAPEDVVKKVSNFLGRIK